MKYLTYLLYILLWETAVLGGVWYAVFILNRSGWWFLLAVLLSGAAYKPKDWLKDDCQSCCFAANASSIAERDLRHDEA